MAWACVVARVKQGTALGNGGDVVTVASYSGVGL